MADLTVQPISEGNGPGWKVTKGKRTYLLWAPRPERDYGRTAMGTPLISPARDQWSVCWDQEDGNSGDYWKADSLDEAVGPLPGDVEQALRAAVEAG